MIRIETSPTYSVREINSLILACGTLSEIERLKEFLLDEIKTYAPADQGFLLAMLGMRMMKICDA
jgi:hypothetical protein